MIPKSIDAYVQNMCHYEHDLVARGIVECMGRCRIASFSIIYGFFFYKTQLFMLKSEILTIKHIFSIIVSISLLCNHPFFLLQKLFFNSHI
jgi:hypothetical protein